MGSGHSTDSASMNGNGGLRDVDLYAQVENLPKLLKQRQRELDAREKELERAVKALEKEKKMLTGAADPGDVIRLNVGGAHIAVMRQTLTSVPGSMLASRFSGRFDSTLVKDSEGRYFIEQSIHLFDPLVNFLRAKRCQTDRAAPPVPPVFGDKHTQDDFNRMVEYFGMTLGVYPVTVTPIIGDTKVTVVSDDLVVRSTEYATVAVTPLRHSRIIESYEVTVVDVERIQIGWAGPSNAALGKNGTGVGDAEGSIAIDFTRGGIVVGGEFTQVDGVVLKGTRTVVKSAKFGTLWYIDDVLVAPTDDLPVKYKMDVSMIPTVSVKGEIQITDVVYQI